MIFSQNKSFNRTSKSMVSLITMIYFLLVTCACVAQAGRSSPRSSSRSASSSIVIRNSTSGSGLTSGNQVGQNGNVTAADNANVNSTNSKISAKRSSSVLKVPDDLQQVYAKIAKGNKYRGSQSRGPIPTTSVAMASGNDSNDPGKSLNLAKNGQTKQSWLAVASAVAHSAAAETNEPTGATSVTDDSKPTKYHYYPHNQHLYLLPECATQQVCSAVYLRLNYSQPLCACPNFHEPCSVSTRTDDRHTIPLVTGSNSQVLTLVKTCESTQEVRECRAPKDWSILALQNSRTGKAHYLVICRCPSSGFLEGPIAHSQPAYARVPGIRVYGMTCVRQTSRTGKGRQMNFNTQAKEDSQNPYGNINSTTGIGIANKNGNDDQPQEDIT